MKGGCAVGLVGVRGQLKSLAFQSDLKVIGASCRGDRDNDNDACFLTLLHLMLLHRQVNPLIAARRNDPGVSLGSLLKNLREAISIPQSRD